MEGPVKERLTGALILVAALAIIVPEILSGPEPEAVGAALPPAQATDAGPPMLTYSMELNGTGDPAVTAQSTLVPQPTAAEPMAVAPAPAPVTVPDIPEEAAAVVSEVAASLPAVPAAPTAAKPVASTQAPVGKWWTQLGSFASKDNADRLMRKLRDEGFAMDMSKVGAAGKELYRVRAGPVSGRIEAQALQARLAANGHKSTIVAP